MRTRIVYVLNTLNISGGIRVVIEHVNGLAARGHDVALVTLDGSGPLESWMPVHCPVASLREARSSGLIADSEVCVATHWSTAPVVDDLADGRRFYFVQMREDWHAPGQRDQVLSTYRLPLHPIATSRWVRDFLEIDFDHRDVPVLPNGVDHGAFFPDPGHFPRTPCVLRVLLEGHDLCPAKNLSDAFDVVDLLRGRGIALEVWGFSQVFNGYPYDRFFFRPDARTIRRLYSDADLFLKTSRVEGRPLPMAEAMACGCPIAAMDCLGNDDHEGVAVITPRGDVHAMADAVIALLGAPAALASMRRRGLARAAGLTWPGAIDRLEEVLGVRPIAGLRRGRVGVLVPTFDRPGRLGEALASVRAQTHPDWRCFVVVNGRSDPAGYREALAPFAGDGRFSFLDLPDAGMTAALNAGLALAGDCEYLAVLDDDDAWKPGFLDALTSVMDRDPMVGLAYCRVREELDGEPVDLIGWREDFDRVDLLESNWIPFPFGVFRRRPIADSGGFDPAAGGCTDWDTWLRVSASMGVVRLGMDLAVHRWHGGNFSLSDDRMRSGYSHIQAKRKAGLYDPPRPVVSPSSPSR